jgi:1,2-diacylglycerol 3-beta-galactosyltransferase
MATVDFVYVNAGGGHRAAATALQAVTEKQLGWTVRLLNLQDVLEPIDIVRKLTGVRFDDWYNKIMKRGWTFGAAQMIPVLQAVIRHYHKDQVRLLEAHWKQSPPDLVVAMNPHFNRALFEGLRRVSPTAPYVTILTDLADFPPHFWMEKQEQHFICGTERAVEQARALAHREQFIHRVSGMILNPRFYEPMEIDRRGERLKLGLDADKPTGLVLFGGLGSSMMEKIARHLDASDVDAQFICICGHNEKLAARLRETGGRLKRHVEGFTKEIPYFMRLSDFFIGKPGPGSISEALAMRLPVIVQRNFLTLPQERYNAQWVVEKQVGFAVAKAHEFPNAVGELLRPENFEKFRKNAAALNNRAVFEIPEILRRIAG